MKFTLVLKSVLVGIPIGITFFDTVGYVARVEGISMQPSLNPNSSITDYVLLNRWCIRSFDISRGDIISLVSPKDPDQTIIKRVVGVEGDIISTISYKRPFIRVPEGHIWVEGDHTGHSMDSNSFGPVALGLVTAKAQCIVWPPSRWQSIKSEILEGRKPVNMK
ncbi:unnamed protein product [Timema podura]|nr:unnamed protein product [Timema shepardi]CAG2061873.1 unnamed protein product [Timema podura]